MEKFGPDEKMLVLMQLPSREILTVCESSKEMNTACQNSKYDGLWKKKIREEYDIVYDGNKGYQEYKFLKQLYEKPLYALIINDEENEEGEPLRSLIFDSRAKS